ncbi:metalloprotease [Coemansia spiralis]|uniref:Metalloprotease n=2 Tax=Coemansia TaxID=4863 RepID=A0A9W8G4B1_9FUNG|nr:metalloprotease [Coemansia spiralis]
MMAATNDTDADALPDWDTQFKPCMDTSFHEYAGDLMLPASSHRIYKLLCLANNMRALCISDPQLQHSAVSLAISVGSSSDPQDAQGLAHVLEQLLFMGTAKYPAPDDFGNYISVNGGSVNTETLPFTTCYHLSINHSALSGALDRLAQFFIAPLLSPVCVEREICAVQAEFESSFGNDNVRLLHLLRALSKADHPYAQFRVGNCESLGSVHLLCNKIKRFFGSYYSADIMRLVVISALPVDELANMIDVFSAVPSLGDPRPSFSSPFSSASRIVWFETVSYIYVIHFSFALPDIRQTYKANADKYVSELLCANGSGSLISCLRRYGWATALRSSCDIHPTFGVFDIHVSATPLGYANYKKLAMLVFSFIDLLCSHGPLEWYYREMQMVGKMQFERAFDDTMEMAKALSLSMCNDYLEPAHVVANCACYDFDAEQLQMFIEHLRLCNCRLFLGSPSKIMDGQLEPYYKITYKAAEMGDCLTADIKHPESYGLQLPLPNTLLPPIAYLQEPNCSSSLPPVLLKKTEMCELWMATTQSTLSGFVQGDVFVYIENLVSGQSPRKSVYTKLLVSLALHQVNEQLSKRVEIQFKLSACENGILVSVSGTQARLIEVVLQILTTIRRCRVGVKEFANEVATQKRDFEVLDQRAPGKIASYQLFSMTGWHYHDCIAELQMVGWHEFEEFVCKAFAETRVVMLCVGAFSESEVLNAMSKVQQSLMPTHPIPRLQRPRHVAHDLHKGTYLRHIVHNNAANKHNAVCYTVHVGKPNNNRRSRALALLAAHVVKQPFFNQLRTVEQLGYIVWSSWVDPGKTHGANSLCFVVQGTNNAWYLRLRIEAFLCNFRNMLEAMSSEEFAAIIKGLVETNKEHSKRKLGKQFWTCIESGHYDFEQTEAVCAQLQMLTLSDLLMFWDTYISPRAVQLTRIIVHVWSDNMQLQLEYSTQVLALHSCLCSLEMGNMTLKDVDGFVSSCISDNLDTDTMFDRLCQKIEICNNREKLSQVKCALGMALIQTDASDSLLANVMQRTVDGELIITDYIAFKALQPTHGLTIPFSPLIPKYS